MTWRVWMLASPLALGLALASVGAPLVGSDLTIPTWESTPVAIRIVVTDPQIDVLSPESHVIRFAILDGPSHGALVGDLDAVLYEPPSVALVVLSYVPATGYVGSDAFSVRASDPSQSDVVLRVAVDVGQSVAGGMLGGHSQWTATIDVPATTMTSMSWVADVSYTVLATTIEPGFAFKLEGADPAFDDFYVTVTTPFGVLGTASLRLDFNPDPLSDLFDYAAATLAVRLGGASIAASFYADGTQTGSRASLQFSGVTPDDELSLSARVTLASCSPTFESATATVRLPRVWVRPRLPSVTSASAVRRASRATVSRSSRSLRRASTYLPSGGSTLRRRRAFSSRMTCRRRASQSRLASPR